ncbi:MAG: LysR family transcriptional regulator [Pseudomonadota bacterium]
MLHSSLLNQIDMVARAGSIRRAAEQLNVSASSINRRILQLEQQLGSPLFHRSRNGVRLSSAGEILIAHVRQTLRDAARMEGRLEELSGMKGAVVRISAAPSLAEGLLARACHAFHDQNPGVFLRVRARSVSEIEADLANGEADLGLAYGFVGEPRIAPTATFSTKLGVVLAPEHGLAQRSQLRLWDLIGHTTAFADPSTAIHALIVDAFSKADIPFMPGYLTNSIGMLKTLAQRGAALTLLPSFDVDEELRDGTLHFIPLVGKEIPDHELVLGHRRGATLNPATTLFEEVIRAEMSRARTAG